MVILGAMLLGACAAADPPAQLSGCTMDWKKACQYIIDQPGFTLNGVSFDKQRMENVSVRHIDVHVPLRSSNASMTCVIDTQSARVTQANLDPGPQPDASNIEQMRKDGLCQ